MAFECADGALCSISAVHVRGDKLELGFPLDGDGFLARGTSFIVKNLEVDGKAASCQSRHDSVLGCNSVTVIPGLENLLEDDVPVGMEGDYHILVA